MRSIVGTVIRSFKGCKKTHKKKQTKQKWRALTVVDAVEAVGLFVARVVLQQAVAGHVLLDRRFGGAAVLLGRNAALVDDAALRRRGRRTRRAARAVVAQQRHL